MGDQIRCKTCMGKGYVAGDPEGAPIEECYSCHGTGFFPVKLPKEKLMPDTPKPAPLSAEELKRRMNIVEDHLFNEDTDERTEDEVTDVFWLAYIQATEIARLTAERDALKAKVNVTVLKKPCDSYNPDDWIECCHDDEKLTACVKGRAAGVSVRE